MKIGKRISELWKSYSFAIFSLNISPTTIMNMQNKWVDDVIASQLPTYFEYDIFDIMNSCSNPYGNLSPPPLYCNLSNDCFAFIKMGFKVMYYILRYEKWDSCQFSVKIKLEVWGNDITNSLICIYTHPCSAKYFVKICETLKFYFFLLIVFVLFSSKCHHSVCMFSFSIEINWKLSTLDLDFKAIV